MSADGSQRDNRPRRGPRARRRRAAVDARYGDARDVARRRRAPHRRRGQRASSRPRRSSAWPWSPWPAASRRPGLRSPELSRSQHAVADTAKSLQQGTETTVGSITELSATIVVRCRKDVTELASSADSTAATLEEVVALGEGRGRQRRGSRRGERGAPRHHHRVGRQHRRHGQSRAVERRRHPGGGRHHRGDVQGHRAAGDRRADGERAHERGGRLGALHREGPG